MAACACEAGGVSKAEGCLRVRSRGKNRKNEPKGVAEGVLRVRSRGSKQSERLFVRAKPAARYPALGSIFLVTIVKYLHLQC